MLRRAAFPLSTTARRLCAASALSAGSATRFQSANATTTGERNNTNTTNNNNMDGRRGNNRNTNRQRVRRAMMPPAFDIVHWNDEDITKGHLLRVLHRDKFIVLDYHRQVRKSTTEGAADGAAAPTGEQSKRAERVVTVTLSPAYIARFLGVLEGRMDKVEVQSRFTNATFAPNAASGPHHYSLHCVSLKPTSGQQLTADGADVNEESVTWNVEMDPAESLMLHRFLSQALQYNTGFTGHIF